MSALTRQIESPFAVLNWQPDVVQLLDEHHLIAISDSPRRRMHFAVTIGQFLQGLRDAEVCTLYGRYITDVESFCYQLERAIPGPLLDRRIDGPRGLTSLLRSRQIYRGRTPSKFRFYIWHDADVLLSEDESLFARIVDAVSGVAAESEYASEDVLLIHRAVYVGSPILSAYADSVEGQFQSWASDSEYDDPFWKVVTGLERPPFARFPIDGLSK
jgi:hypothetical protein